MLLDAQGNPVQPSKEQIMFELMKAFEQMQNAMLFLEMKVNFMLKKLQDTGTISQETLNEEWSEFFNAQMKQVAEARQEEINSLKGL